MSVTLLSLRSPRVGVESKPVSQTEGLEGLLDNVFFIPFHALTRHLPIAGVSRIFTHFSYTMEALEKDNEIMLGYHYTREGIEPGPTA